MSVNVSTPLVAAMASSDLVSLEVELGVWFSNTFVDLKQISFFCDATSRKGKYSVAIVAARSDTSLGYTFIPRINVCKTHAEVMTKIGLIVVNDGPICFMNYVVKSVASKRKHILFTVSGPVVP